MRGSTVAARLKILAGILLGFSALLPISSLPAMRGEENTFKYAWELARDDWHMGVWLGLVYFWPVLLMLLRRHAGHRVGRLLISTAEPVLAGISAGILIALSTAILSWWFVIPVRGHTAVGGWLGVVADGIYLLGWVMGFSRRLVSRRTALSDLRRTCA